jgi:hypothetical protein
MPTSGGSLSNHATNPAAAAATASAPAKPAASGPRTAVAIWVSSVHSPAAQPYVPPPLGLTTTSGPSGGPNS